MAQYELARLVQAAVIGLAGGYAIGNTIIYYVYDMQMEMGRPPEEIEKKFFKWKKLQQCAAGPGVYFAVRKHKKMQASNPP